MINMIKIRFLIVLLIDLFISIISINLAAFLRLGEFFINSYEVIIAAIVVPITFYFFKIYKTSWRYFSLLDMWSLIRVCLIANIFIFISIFILNRLEMIPRLVILLNFFSLSALTCGARIVYRSMFEKLNLDISNRKKGSIPVLLVGSEENADDFIRGTERKNSSYKAIGIISEDKTNNKEYLIRGVPVLGVLEETKQIISRLHKKNHFPQRLVIVSNSIKSKEMSELMKISDKNGMKLGRAPAPSEVLDSNTTSLVREISLEDLLGRRQNRLNTNQISKLINNKVVLITGAGGSIGSKLAKKVTKLDPKKLVMLDLSENAIYNLKTAFEKKSNSEKYTFLCSNIRNKTEMEKLFSNFRPDIIFHAGALKHVTICEENISEAIRTNVISTAMLANLAEKFGCSCFVQISTDKAVEPTSVMGLTKKLAEIVIQSKDKLSKNNTRFITVRFGNVLGSTGSVVPLFRRQLSKGGPLTVTDKNATRFFMTIEEAVDLVIYASAENIFRRNIPKGCINVLNMGASVKIDDLAKQIIRLSGLVPGKDIKIKYIGLNKGEKLYEKLYGDYEEKIDHDVEGYFLVKSKKNQDIKIENILINLEKLCNSEEDNLYNKLFKILG